MVNEPDVLMMLLMVIGAVRATTTRMTMPLACYLHWFYSISMPILILALLMVILVV